MERIPIPFWCQAKNPFYCYFPITQLILCYPLQSNINFSNNIMGLPFTHFSCPPPRGRQQNASLVITPDFTLTWILHLFALSPPLKQKSRTIIIICGYRALNFSFFRIIADTTVYARI